MGGIDGSSSVGSASLNSFINQPSNRPGAEWNQKSEAKTKAPLPLPSGAAAFAEGARKGANNVADYLSAGVLGFFSLGCSNSGNDQITPPKQQPTPDGGVLVNPDSGLTNTGIIVTPDGAYRCEDYPGGCIINLPVGNALPDAGPDTTAPSQPDSAPVSPTADAVPGLIPQITDAFVPGVDAGSSISPSPIDTGNYSPIDAGTLPDTTTFYNDTNYVVPLPPPDGPTPTPSIDTAATAAKTDTQPLTTVPAKVLSFSEHPFDIKLTGNAAAVQEAINPKPFTITNMQGNLNCDANTQYYLVFWTQGDKVTDTGGTPLESYFPNVCKNGVLNIARASDIDKSYTNDQGYPYGFQFPPVDEKNNQIPRPPLVLTSVDLAGQSALTKTFEEGLPLGDKEAACAGTLPSVPARVLIPQNNYCTAGQTGPVGNLNLPVDNVKFLANTSSAELSSTLASYWRQNIWVGVVEVKK